ncbi:hypothetical protein [Polyangium sp. y55x31]|uniref:hypothetical protein n=1 Tax=Polyangium sp. y55x31 TaxID=3042688 RepID=UPI002483056B|nr:hypothetical protein [Polyangium sp. y55x31]MDI1483593.1 hypothetical protein [Polyangium sp. y55x31]
MKSYLRSILGQARSSSALRASSFVLATAAGLATSLGGADAHAYDCNAPTATLCRDRNFLLACDTATVRNYCDDILDADLRAPASDSVPLYRPAAPKTLSNLVSGEERAFLYVTPTRTSFEQLMDAMGHTWVKEERKARDAAWSLPKTVALIAQTWRRNPAWDDAANPAPILSCDEFVYERFYTYERFLDAAYRCQQDPWCIADMASKRFLANDVAPGAMGGLRDLRTRWGAVHPDGHQVEQLTNTVIPASVFHTEAAVGFLPDSVIDVLDLYPAPAYHSLTEVRDRMFHLRKKYVIGNNPFGAGQVHYDTEIDWHVGMTSSIKQLGISKAEREDIRARQAELARAIKEFMQLYHEEVMNGGAQTLPSHTDDPPLDGVTERLFINAIGSKPKDTEWKLYNAGTNYLSPKRESVHSMVTGVYTGTSSNVADAFQFTSGDLGYTVAEAFTYFPPVVKPGNPRRLQCLGETQILSTSWAKIADRACKVTNLILTEWEKSITTGDRGCLTKDFEGCDWAPEDFTERFAKKQFLMKERESELKRCDKLTNNFSFADSYAPPGGGMTFGQAKGSGLSMAVFLNNEEAARESTLEGVPRRDSTGRSFGETYTSAELIGDKSNFAAGYNTSVSWTADVIKNSSGQICRMNASATGDLDVYAHIFGFYQELLDAHGEASVIDGDGHVNAYVRVAGVNVFPEVDNDYDFVNGVEIEHLNENEQRTYDGFRKWFTAGPIPVEVGARAEVFYGAKFTTTLKAPESCIANQTNTELAKLLQAESAFTPFVNVNGIAYLTAGIPSVLSVGIDGTLNLIKAALPVRGKVQVGIIPDYHGQPNVAAITFDSSANLELSTLSGSVDLTFEALGFPVKVNMFKWDGVSGTVPLLKSPEAIVPLYAIP